MRGIGLPAHAIGLLAFIFNFEVLAQEHSQKAYSQQAVVGARFGGQKGRDLVVRAEGTAGVIQEQIYGQDEMAMFLQKRIYQWALNIDRSDKPTIAVLLGLQGVGKSRVLQLVAKHLGIEVITLDSQQYANNQMDFAKKIRNEVRPLIRQGKPYLIAINEVDKLNEIVNEQGARVTHPLIGVINEIVEEGTIAGDSAHEEPTVLKNALVMMTMNFAPADISRYSPIDPETQQPKSFYDLDYADMRSLDEQLLSRLNLRYDLLSHLFRPNTVDRLAPHTVIMRSSLDEAARTRIVAGIVEREVAKFVADESARLKITWNKSFVDFIVNAYNYAPGGPRGLISWTEDFVLPILAASIRTGNMSQPRDVNLSAHPQGVRIAIQAYKRVGKQLALAKAETLELPFEAQSQKLLLPAKLKALPDLVQAGKERTQGMTKKMIREARFPAQNKKLQALPGFLGKKFFGREAEIKILTEDISRYMARRGAAVKTPAYRALAGLQGEGKSELPEQAARYLGIPIVRVNLAEYVSEDNSSKIDLEAKLLTAIENARDNCADGMDPKYVLIFDELDKLREIDVEGKPSPLPAMALIKSLLSEGVVHVEQHGDMMPIDVRDAMIFFTMNFGRDLLQLPADPRLTSTERVREAMNELFRTPASTQDVLKSLFSPEMINRLLPFFTVFKSLDDSAFQAIVRAKSREAVAEYFKPDDQYEEVQGPEERAPGSIFPQKIWDLVNKTIRGDEDDEDDDLDFSRADEGSEPDLKSAAAVKVHLTKTYIAYLNEETIVPSEGGRYTTLATKSRVSADVDTAMRAFPRRSEYSGSPIRLILDFDFNTSTVSSSFVPLDKKIEPIAIEKHAVMRSFKPLRTDGPVSLYRLHVGIHEFGHAFVGILLGFRFTNIVSAPLQPGAGGYVELRRMDKWSGDALLADLLMTVGSRAMERVILSQEPGNPQSIFESSGDGPSRDIEMATGQLYDMLYRLGLNPFGGTLDHSGGANDSPYAFFDSLPSEDVHKLEKIVRRLENELVSYLHAEFEASWYDEKITGIVREGQMTEEQVYRLLSFPFPGKNSVFVGAKSPAATRFQGLVSEESAEIQAARQFRRGKSQYTAEETLRYFRNIFFEELRPMLKDDCKAVLLGMPN